MKTNRSYIMIDQPQDLPSSSQSSRHPNLSHVANVSGEDRYLQRREKQRPVVSIDNVPVNYPRSPPTLRSMESTVFGISGQDGRIVKLQPLPESMRKPSATDNILQHKDISLKPYSAPAPNHQDLRLQPLTANNGLARTDADKQDRVKLIPLNAPDYSIQRQPQSLEGTHASYLTHVPAARDGYLRHNHFVDHIRQPLHHSYINTDDRSFPGASVSSPNPGSLDQFMEFSSPEGPSLLGNEYQEAHSSSSSVGTDRRIILLPKDDHHPHGQLEASANVRIQSSRSALDTGDYRRWPSRDARLTPMDGRR